MFAELKKHPDACAQQLVRSLRTSPRLESRGLCAVLLRKVRAGGGRSICNQAPACRGMCAGLPLCAAATHSLRCLHLLPPPHTHPARC